MQEGRGVKKPCGTFPPLVVGQGKAFQVEGLSLSWNPLSSAIMESVALLLVSI